jgi:hypothetical protein
LIIVTEVRNTLAVVLLGVAEILKHRPTPENVRMGAEIHRGYRRVAPKETKYRESRREIDRCVASIKREALPHGQNSSHIFPKSQVGGIDACSI